MYYLPKHRKKWELKRKSLYLQSASEGLAGRFCIPLVSFQRRGLCPSPAHKIPLNHLISRDLLFVFIIYQFFFCIGIIKLFGITQIQNIK